MAHGLSRRKNFTPELTGMLTLFVPASLVMGRVEWVQVLRFVLS
jgi:hypothetical protein